MNTTYRLSALALIVVLASCGAPDKNKELTKKKEELASLKEEQKSLATKIDSVQAQILRLDTSAKKEEKTKLVGLSPVTSGQFVHYIDLKGKIEAVNVASVMPRNQGGQVKAIYVKQGDVVRKGQLLMKLDDAIIQQQIEQTKLNLNLAKTTYERRKNLWDQKIGTEIELLNAKNAVDNQEKAVEMLKEQLDMSNVYAEMNGVAETVNIKVGETFSAASAAMLGITIVNSNDLKITAEVPENYLGRVGVGSNLLITLPELGGDTIRTKVNVSGKLINPNTRSFYVESRISANNRLHPNQLAIVRIQDYATPNTVTIPIGTIQSDDKGKFVMVAAKEKDKLLARKRAVTIGEYYGERLEIKSGLQAGDQLITEGFQGLYDGQPITTDVK